MVDEDYGARVEKGLGTTSFKSMVGTFAKKVGISSDKSNLIGENVEQQDKLMT